MFFFFFLSNLLTDLQWNCVRVWFLTHEILLFCQKLHHKKRSTGESPPGYWDIIISSSSILSKIINLSIISTSISIRINISISISIFPAQLLDSDVKQQNSQRSVRWDFVFVWFTSQKKTFLNPSVQSWNWKHATDSDTHLSQHQSWYHRPQVLRPQPDKILNNVYDSLVKLCRPGIKPLTSVGTKSGSFLVFFFGLWTPPPPPPPRHPTSTLQRAVLKSCYLMYAIQLHQVEQDTSRWTHANSFICLRCEW